MGNTVLAVAGTWTAVEKATQTIAELELYASTVGLVALAPAAELKEVYSFTDNTVALAAMRSLAPTAPAMQQLTTRRVAWMQQEGVREAAERVTTDANLWADLLSRRGGCYLFEQQVTALGMELR